jgi:hypothetical protein
MRTPADAAFGRDDDGADASGMYALDACKKNNDKETCVVCQSV